MVSSDYRDVATARRYDSSAADMFAPERTPFTSDSTSHVSV
jgi:hypothetical protein